MSTSIVFIDTRVADYQTLIDGLEPGAEFYLIDSQSDGLEQIAARLQGRTGIEAIHIISHGSSGSVLLGSRAIDSAALATHASQLEAIGRSLSETGDILLYGCNVAAGDAGVQFIGSLALATGADVAASMDLTGTAGLGGDWVLEQSIGDLEFAGLQVANYHGILPSSGRTTPTAEDIRDAGLLAVAAYKHNELSAQAYLESLPGSHWTWVDPHDYGVTSLLIDSYGYFTNTNGQALIARDSSSNRLAIAFRGTEPNWSGGPADLIADVFGGLISFNAVYQVEFNNFIDSVLSQTASDTKILIAGHSLGGAMAEQLMGEESDNRLVGVTFGSPGTQGLSGNYPRIDSRLINFGHVYLSGEVGTLTTIGAQGDPVFRVSRSETVQGTDLRIFLPEEPVGLVEGVNYQHWKDQYAISAARIAETIENNIRDLHPFDVMAFNYIRGTSSLASVLSGTSTQDVIIGDAYVDEIHGSGGNDIIDGRESDDILYGEGANDIIYGGAGVDEMHGGPGNDTYVIDTAADRVIESSTEGTDLVQAYATFTLASNVENLDLMGVTAIDGTGNELANKVTGNAAANTLHGGAGKDTLDGGTGTDTLYGEAGNDVLKTSDSGDILDGGADGDTYEVNMPSGGTVTLTDASGTDKLRLIAPGAIHANTVFTVSGNDLVIEARSASATLGTVTIKNMGTATNQIETMELVGTSGSIDNYSLVTAWTWSLAHPTDHTGGSAYSGTTSGNTSYADDGNNTITCFTGSGIFDGYGGIDLLIVNASPSLSYYYSYPYNYAHQVTYVLTPTAGQAVGLNNGSSYASISNGLALDLQSITLTTGSLGSVTYSNIERVNLTAINGAGGYGGGDLLIYQGTGGESYDGGTQNTYDTFYAEWGTGTQAVIWTNNSVDTFSLNAPGGLVSVRNVERLLLTTGTGNDVLDNTANSTDDTFITGGGGDTIRSGAGNDFINSGSGDDSIFAGTGTDTVDGGAADVDTLTVDASSSLSYYYSYPYNYAHQVTYVLTPMAGAAVGLNNGSTYAAIHDGLALDLKSYNVTMGSLGSVTYSNIERVNLTAINGAGGYGGGDLLIYQGTGGESYDGGTQNTYDTFYAEWGTGTQAVIWTNNSVDTFSLNAPGGLVSVRNVERLLLTTGTGNDVLDNTANSTDDTFITGGGGDTIRSGAGNDSINSGSGDDTISAGTGTDTVDGGTDVDTLTVDASSSAATYPSGPYVLPYQVTYVLTPTAGAAVGLNNGSTYAAIHDGLALDLKSYNVTMGSLGSVTYSNIERVNLTAINSSPGYGGGDLLIYQGTGGEIYNGGTQGTYDTFYAEWGTGTQAVIWTNNSVDTFSLNAPGGLVSVRNVERLLLTTGTGNDVLDNTANSTDDTFITGGGGDTIRSGAGSDFINSGSGDDTLDGGAGTDTLIGGTGNDTYVVDATTDVVTENLNEGIDLVQSSVTLTLAANVENLTLIGTAAINGTGNALDNVITGNAGINILDGGTGADTLAGGAGNDTYVVDNMGDVVTEIAVGGTDLVQSSLSYALNAEVENLTLTGAAAIDGTGNTLNNILTGNVANNRLDGGAGNDTLAGGLGDDTYVVDSATDVVTEAAAAGADSVLAGVSHTLAVNVENLTLTGVADIDGTGNTLNNILIGNIGNNVLGGGTGNDTLTGGGGNDTFLFAASGNGSDLIMDFGSGDRIKVTGAAFAAGVLAQGTGTTLLANQAQVSADGLRLYIGTNATAGVDIDIRLNAAVAGPWQASGDSLLTGSNAAPTGTVTITGTARQGQTLTAGNTLADTDGLGEVSYQWQSSSDGSTWNNAGTGTTLSLTQGLVGSQIKVIAAYTDGLGKAESITAVPTAAVAGYQAGSAGTDSLVGTSYLDTLLGNAGTDTLNGGGGNDTLDGGLGIDTAVYSGAKSAYTLAKSGSSYTITDSVGGRDGSDTLTGIEKLQFSDQTFILSRAAHDYNGDGKSDTMWRYTDGSTSLWLMNGTSVQTYGSFGAIPTAWKITATADFNGDGQADWLWRHTDGSTSLWLMNGTSPQGYGSFGPIPTTWQITTTGDFNGDGKTDLMWRHTDGSTSLWLMNGTTAQGYGSFGQIPTGWQITATADYNGDGKSDLMWRHTDGSTSLWLMNGTVAQGYGSFGPIPVTWSILDSQGDYNGDGKNDLLWRNTDGTTNLWLMNGTSVQTYGSLGQVATSWTVVDAHGDYNGDGKSDILWRNSDGSTSLWLMNGTAVQTYGSFGQVPASWSPVAGDDPGTTLTGDGGGNALVGTVNSDTLIGLGGNDTLTGGAGADRFVFNTALNASTNVDTITDFSSGTDKILLDHLILTALTTGTLAASSFVAEAGATAHDGNDYLLYNTTTGDLSYDPDGTGVQSAVLFAHLNNHPAMAAADLAVV